MTVKEEQGDRTLVIYKPRGDKEFAYSVITKLCEVAFPCLHFENLLCPGPQAL